MKKILSFLVFLSLSFNSIAADPDLFYYVSDGNNSLYTINRVTGVATLIGATGVSSIEAIAFYPVPGANQLFAADAGTFGELNTTTGAFTAIGEVDGGGTANGLAGAQTLNDVDGLMLDGQTFIMWAIERKGGATPDLLFQIDVTTGLFVPNAFGVGIDYLVITGDGIDVDVDDLAVDPGTGRIYGTSNNGGTGDVLIEINKYTGSFTLSSTLSQDDVEGLAFSNDGTLYGSEGDGDNRLSEINISTGVMSNFFGFTGSDVEGLASLTGNANTVRGAVYDDTNEDGIKDGGEVGIPNITMFLYLDNNNDGKIDPEDTRIQTTVTDGNGDYAFYYVSTGNLLVRTNYPSYPFGFGLTTDNVESAIFTDNVNFNEVDVDNNFGLANGPDCDGDGFPDFFEGNIDSDGDGIIDNCDLDSDNDGILDRIEGFNDFDGDGIPDYIDRDSDDDGIPDAIEANGGVIPAEYNSISGNMSGVDSDGNGIIDSRETGIGTGVMVAPNPDTDGDGIRDYVDLDSDNDGILDIIEAGGVDLDGDGQVDGVTDLNNNGYSDLLESNGLPIFNTDLTFETNNGLTPRPDYIDLDSDADGIDDTREGLSTANYGFPTLILDADEDGIVDFWDVSAFNTPITPYDRDGDGIPDYRDTDSDNDGVADDIEGNDDNSDGVRDLAFSNLDANNNGLDDAFDGDCGAAVNSRATDFGEQTVSNGDMYLGSSDLELVNDAATNGGQQIVGLYFPSINVAQGTSVNGAYVQFETDEVGTGPITLTIEGHLVADAPTFTTANSNISSRTRTTNSVTWSPGNWNTVGEIGGAQRTVDISSIINEILAQGSWSQGNDIVIIFSGPAGNFRTAEVDPLLTILVESSICFSNVAVQDFDSDGERDWRDTDDDQDGIPTISEIPDSEPNGTPDYLEASDNQCGIGFVTDTVIVVNTIATPAQSQTQTGGVGNPDRALGNPDGDRARIDEGESLFLNFGGVVSAGNSYTVTWRRRNGGGSSTETMFLAESLNGSSYTAATSASTSNTTLFSTTFTAVNDFQFLRITKNNGGDREIEVDAVVADVNDNDTTFNCEVDTDSDGIPDTDDIDDDNDGILDVDENSGCSGSITQSLRYEFYDVVPSGNTVDNIPTTGATGTGSVTSIDVDALFAAETPGDGNTFSIRYTGFITISTNETYTFFTNSDDGSKLFIDGNEIVDNDGNHAAVEESGTVALTVGTYPITILFYEDAGGEELTVSYSSSSITKTVIPFSVLSETADCDFDLDGIVDRLDLDSDNDGIADIIEAGGVDADNNGRVDAYVDTDGDGWANTFDPENGGTILTDPDTDTDGLENRIDIDADNDGIVDVIEAQLSSPTPKLPSGVDSDGDGVDDVFDADLGGFLLTPVNTDELDNPDYTDTDSDNDGISDLIEAYDTDRDGVANTLPSGTDSDNDGLDDGYDTVDGRNSSTNVTNSGQTSESFPDDDNPFTPERDWREFSDNDGDGIPDEIDVDDDNDGILDVDECSNLAFNGGFENLTGLGFGNNIGENISPWTNVGPTNVIFVDGVGGVNYGNGGPEVDARGGAGNYYDVAGTSGTIYQTFTLTNDAFVRYHVFYSARDGGSGDVEATILAGSGPGGAVQSTTGSLLTSDNVTWQYISNTVQLSAGTYTYLIDIDNFINVDEASVSTFCDSDGDGIPNQYDLDSDNDGIPDIIEAGGVDSDGDGRVDDDTDTDGDGWADTFDNTNGGIALIDEDRDGDGLKNRIDLDADNDGIADIVEAGGEDANGDGKADNFTDGNANGWSNTYDVTEAGENLVIVDTDGDGISNYLDLDSDSDGIIDNIEGQTTADFQIPLGTDTDNDGWDDQYDSDDGGTAIVLSNNNATGPVDYLDQDSDGDGQPDWIERADDDEDGDALLDLIALADAYEVANANPNHYVSTDDVDGDDIPDFLEDVDSDGIPNFLDPDNATFFRDVDQDGIVDFYDADQNGDSRDNVTQLGELDNDGAPDFRDNDNNVSLPIELVRFIATKVGENVQLDWTTATEINNDYFTIERSVDGEFFEPILTEKGAGTSSKIIHYRRFDNQPFEGYNYYRLKQTDFNGENKEFNIEVVKFETFGNIKESRKYSVYPNPTTGRELFLEIDQPKAGEYQIKIMSPLGKLISQRTFWIESETIYFEQEILRGLRMAKGVYFLSVQVDAQIETFKFVVQ